MRKSPIGNILRLSRRFQAGSSIDGEIITDYGVKNTYINLGTGYGFGTTTSNTININKWLKRNIYRSPQFY